MEIRELAYFVAVAEEGSFSAAADRLHMTQPPLSQSVAKLEKKLGCRLFERGQRVAPRLTPQGRLLLKEAKRLLRQAAELESMMRTEGKEWPLRIGVIPSVIAGLVTPVVVEFQRRHDAARIVLEEAEERDLLAGVRSASYDLGFTRAVRLPPGMQLRPLMLEPLYAVVAESHPLAHRGQISVSELWDEEFVLFLREDAPRAYDHIVRTCIRSGFVPRIAMHASNDLALLSFVACGLGVTIVPFLSTMVPPPGVAFLRVERWAVSPLSLVRRIDSENPFTALFEDAVAGHIASLAASHGIEGNLVLPDESLAHRLDSDFSTDDEAVEERGA
ncbi:LysR substrate-binding domain-containing protein [Microbacterium ulmi]|uniref:LysR family transcriptional regulator n=1 Tax=Microbacterium ulmi TaxID=179095 RepID=A0A7Y2LYX0_9MICO|nr:DNA-binding transcriptional LysR family regulator [Microbacterium ulmi]NNH03107.1 LysR family transcriptional regulator [Microbacterium ulmi]